MIGMIVVGAGRDDDVCLPQANLTDNLFANLQCGKEFPVVVIENFVFNADASSGFLSFCTAAIG